MARGAAPYPGTVSRWKRTSRADRCGTRPPVGVHPLLDIGEVAALDDPVEALGAAHQNAGLAAGQGIGGQLPGRLVERAAVEQLDVAGGMGEQQLDGLGLVEIGGVVDESPVAGLAQVWRGELAVGVQTARTANPSSGSRRRHGRR